MVLRAPRIVADDSFILRYAGVGDMHEIKKLMSAGLASPGDVGFRYGMTALHVAFVNKDIDLCKFLIAHGADQCYETTLRRSVIDIVRDENINGRIPDDKMSQISVIFDESDDYESFQLSPLHKSILGISSVALESQLTSNTVYIDSPDSLGRTALSTAAWRGDVSAVRTLLHFGASPNVCTPTELSPLHRAIESHSYECVQLLIEHSVDENHKNKRGRTPLHYACRVPDDGAIAKLLLENGADVDAEDHGCGRALHEAVMCNQLSQLNLVFSATTRIDSHTANGKTALHLAVCHNNLPALQALLHAGADPGTYTKRNSTLLHLAARFANLETMNRLKGDHGVAFNFNQVNKNGFTACDMLASNPNYSEELKSAFIKLAAEVTNGVPGSAFEADSDVEDVYEDAVDSH